MLQKLYSLYNAVMININSYNDIMWSEVDIEAINVELLEFQTRFVFFVIKCVIFQKRDNDRHTLSVCLQTRGKHLFCLLTNNLSMKCWTQ